MYFLGKIKQRFERLNKLHPLDGFGLTEKERMDIVGALSNSVTTWYKCRNGKAIIFSNFILLFNLGHFYGIGDCGRAVMTSQCPECKETVGGSDYRLNAGNSRADDIMRQNMAPQPVHDPFVARW